MNLLATFQNDPFFSGVDLPNALALEHRPRRSNDTPRNASEHRDLTLFENPFSFMETMMNEMGQMFSQMETRLNDRNDQQGVSYASSTFMSYDGRNGDQPRIVQATSEKLRGSEGFERTRKAVRDTGRNVEKMEVAHRLGERLHRITKERDPSSGRMLENRELNHIENEDEFQREWHHRADRLGLKNLHGQSFSNATDRLLPSLPSKPVHNALEHGKTDQRSRSKL